jgi:preprotein translocase subunit SecB
VPDISEASYKFIAHRISNINFELKENSPKLKLSYEIDAKLKYEEVEDGKFQGVVSLKIKIRGKHGRKTYLKCDATILGKFQNSDYFKEEDFISFCRFNGTATLLPILRSTILSLTALSGMSPPLKIPMINVLRTLESEESFTKEKVNT